MQLTEIKNFLKPDNSFFYRDGTFDTTIIHENFVESNESTYMFPEDPTVKTIYDFGANIGAVSVRLAMQYPEAKIVAYEPVKENFEILKKNTANFPNVVALNFAAGKAAGTLKIFQSDHDINHGGFSLHDAGVNKEVFEEVEMVSLVECYEKIDLIKIDTEGSEFDILTSLPSETLRGVKYIVGEMHGVKDYELFSYLRDAGFDLSIRKPMGARVFTFCAKNIV